MKKREASKVETDERESRRVARRVRAVEALRKSILSAASLLQADPNVSKDTWDYLETDVRCAANALDDISLADRLGLFSKS
jgi:hypothetical protein